jgi:hypothetical protein
MAHVIYRRGHGVTTHKVRHARHLGDDGWRQGVGEGARNVGADGGRRTYRPPRFHLGRRVASLDASGRFYLG